MQYVTYWEGIFGQNIATHGVLNSTQVFSILHEAAGYPVRETLPRLVNEVLKRFLTNSTLPRHKHWRQTVNWKTQGSLPLGNLLSIIICRPKYFNCCSFQQWQIVRPYLHTLRKFLDPWQRTGGSAFWRWSFFF